MEHDADALKLLTYEIWQLVSYGQEGDYWDFKREWYDLGSENNAVRDKARQDLLMDVICLANSTAFRDGYIIIGIDNGTHDIIGIDGDANRRDSEQVIDLLRGRRFAGGSVPHVRVETIELEDKTVDAIVVEPTRDVPCLLAEDFMKLRAGVVYSRDGGTNTPINKGASLQTMGLLWRRRFGLDMTPKEKLLSALADRDAWEETPVAGYENLYLRDAPEFTITFDDEEYGERDENGYEYFFFTQTDDTPRYQYCICKYHDTVLIKTVCAILDGGRLTVPAPEWASVDHGIDMHLDGLTATHYGCYLEDSEDWLLYQLLCDPEKSSHHIASMHLLYSVPVYRDKREQEEFERHVRENKLLEDAVNAVEHVYVPENKVDDYDRRVYLRQLKVSQAMKGLLDQWRADNWRYGYDYDERPR